MRFKLSKVWARAGLGLGLGVYTLGFRLLLKLRINVSVPHCVELLLHWGFGIQLKIGVRFRRLTGQALGEQIGFESGVGLGLGNEKLRNSSPVTQRVELLFHWRFVGGGHKAAEGHRAACRTGGGEEGMQM